MPPAQVGQRLEHRGVGPRALHRGRGAVADAPSSLGRPLARFGQERGLADARWPAHQQRPRPAGRRPGQRSRDRRQLWVPTDEALAADSRGCAAGQQAVTQEAGLRPRVHAQLAAQHAIHALELAQRGVAVSGRREPAHQLQVGLLVAGIQLDQPLPLPGQPQDAGVAAAQLLATIGRPVLVRVLGQQLATVERDGSSRRARRPPRPAPCVRARRTPPRRRSTSASGSSATMSSRRTTASPRAIALRAKCAALCSLGAASSREWSGHSWSIRTSRWRRRPGARARIFTSAAAWRLAHRTSGTAVPSATTSNRPSRATSTAITGSWPVPVGPGVTAAGRVAPGRRWPGDGARTGAATARCGSDARDPGGRRGGAPRCSCQGLPTSCSTDTLGTAPSPDLPLPPTGAGPVPDRAQRPTARSSCALLILDRPSMPLRLASSYSWR